MWYFASEFEVCDLLVQQFIISPPFNTEKQSWLRCHYNYESSYWSHARIQDVLKNQHPSWKRNAHVNLCECSYTHKYINKSKAKGYQNLTTYKRVKWVSGEKPQVTVASIETNAFQVFDCECFCLLYTCQPKRASKFNHTYSKHTTYRFLLIDIASQCGGKEFVIGQV